MTERPLNPVVPCRSCAAECRWVTTRAGKHMLINLEGSLPTDFAFDASRHASHFATCPQAPEWRKKHKRPEAR
jgi:hypothetical protein